jgi:hypothetical protein
MHNPNRRGSITNTEVLFRICQVLSQVTFGWMQVPGEIGMAQTHDTVIVRVTSSEDRRPRRTARRGYTEIIPKKHTFRCQPVDFWSLNRLHTIAPKVLPEIMAVDD